VRFCDFKTLQQQGECLRLDAFVSVVTLQVQVL